MADISDVENAMVTLVAGFLQLGVNYLPGSAATSPLCHTQCRVYRGWPLASALDADLGKGIANVSVFPVAGASRRTTKYVPQWVPQSLVTPTLTATVSGSDIVITGQPDTNMIVGVRFGPDLHPSCYTYRPTISDTSASVAAALGALIPQSTVTGPVLTVPSAYKVEAAVAADQPMWMETRRQDQHVWVIGWCPNPSSRDAIISAMDAGFANLTNAYGALTDQFPLPDGSSARLLYMSSHTDDMPQKANLWRRDLRYIVSYPTTLIQMFPTLLFGVANETEATFDSTISVITGPHSS